LSGMSAGLVFVSSILQYIQHDLLVKDERDDCAVIATRLAAIVSDARMLRMIGRACTV